MFEFTVPEGDWEYEPVTGAYIFKNLVFTEDSWKQAKEAIHEFRENSTQFTMTFTPKEGN